MTPYYQISTTKSSIRILKMIQETLLKFVDSHLIIKFLLLNHILFIFTLQVFNLNVRENAKQCMNVYVFTSWDIYIYIFVNLGF